MTSRRPINGLSHVRGATDTPLLNLTIPALLARTAARLPDHEACIFPKQNIRWSYSKFSKQVDRLAAGLLDLGLGKGDRVGIWSPNRVEWLLTQFATARIGAILVCINPAYRQTELAYALEKVGCAALITAQSFKSSNYLEMIRALDPKPKSLRHVIAMGEAPEGFLAFDDILSDDTARLDAISATLDAHDAINIQFTSGTTGSPKGASLTHHNIVNNAYFTTATMAFTEADRLCIPVPFYHCFGMVMGTLGCVAHGATMVVPGEGFEPRDTLQAVHDEKCTALFGVPTMFVTEMALPDFDNFDLSHLRTGIMAGAPCPRAIMERVQRDMHMTGVTIAYGMTETSPVSFQSGLDDPLDKRVGTVGRIHPHVEVKIIDETGATVPVGTQGELLTRGYSVMQGYWGEDEKTTSAIRDGWMHTGDLATMDDEGYAMITGRVKDMICRGGENIYPREIEEFLFTHPAVAQVQVFGIPDETYGEVVCAWIVTHKDATPAAEDILAFCKGQIAHYKLPLHIRFKDELPMTVTGKPQKFIMSDTMIAELGTQKKAGTT
ncbi:AMP-binding protein [Litoreibacter janthinus]|uniref:3-methylmercaptopropionyl-CoA ligase n=1 Tax=Litoreibacter janthinus TaxID=670154 RepID=A0A1I6GLA9_9RHOB|nr:AMP-binding protein [Litoreibacter janthinus]SFR42936.1 fatty-acyl-CoA synthase [Litoreibacter janthinus]